MRFAADENMNGRILAGLLERLPDLDIIRIQDTSLYGASDPDLLAWLAEEGRILLTHDANTLPGFVYDRVRAGLVVAGVVEISSKIPIGQAIDELEIVIGAGQPSDFENLVRYIPLR